VAGNRKPNQIRNSATNRHPWKTSPKLQQRYLRYASSFASDFPDTVRQQIDMTGVFEPNYSGWNDSVEDERSLHRRKAKFKRILRITTALKAKHFVSVIVSSSERRRRRTTFPKMKVAWLPQCDRVKPRIKIFI
jgi:hypothetical protein